MGRGVALPLLLALVGKAMHITEVGARTVEAPPLEQALEEGGYTECESHARSACCCVHRPACC